MEFIIVTGLSGSGKSRAVDALEDIGFFCVDNMPPSLIGKFHELCVEEQMPKVAVVTDTRGGSLFAGMSNILTQMEEEHATYKILFFEASDEAIVKRYKETRRKHPLKGQFDDSLLASVQREREMLAPLRLRADYIIDTTNTSPAQLRERLASLFLGDSVLGMKVTCMSFGFKYGAATEADIVFDVRCLPNPFYVETLRPLTGRDKPVADYVLEKEETKGFVERMFSLIDYLVPLYANEGKSSLVIAVGCTGGKHRSVALAELLCTHLSEHGVNAGVLHRDIDKKHSS